MDTSTPDQRSAEELILEHLPDVVTLCNRMFRWTGDAEDATHEAVVQILRALPSYRGEGPVRHWLLKVALNAARHHRRTLSRTSRREAALPQEALPGTHMSDPVERREEQDSLRAAIAELPEEIRETVILYYFHNLTQTQIAECVGCTQKTVHVRVKKGLDLLSRRLAGNHALGAMVAAAGAGSAMLDAVSPALVASVKQTVAAHFAAASTAAATATTAAAPSVATTSIATGGIVMNAKLAAGAAVLAVTCLVGGAVLSNAVFASDDGDARNADEVAALRQQVEDARRAAQALQGDLTTAERRAAARLADLGRELTALRTQVAERDRELATLRDAAAADPTADGERARSREERWAELEKTMSGVLAVLQKMGEEGANQFELGPQMVAELGKLSAEDYAEIMAFDADETDPRIVEQIRAVMLQALIFVPKATEHRDEYMARYIERVRRGGFGESFDYGALRSISFRMPPFVDAYEKIVTPLDEDLRREYVDMALRRAADGPTESHRLDGVVFLSRTDDPRATDRLADVLRQPANTTRLRLAAVRGLAERADADVLRLLKDTAASDQDEDVRAAAEQAASRVETRLASER